MLTPTQDQLMQLETKLRAEVQRLHPEGNARRGAVELVSEEAEILLQLVLQAKAAEA